MWTRIVTVERNIRKYKYLVRKLEEKKSAKKTKLDEFLDEFTYLDK